MIYVFGDSHVHFFTCSHPAANTIIEENRNIKYENFISHWVGAGTAYHFFDNRYSLMIKWLNKYDITEKDYVLICAGEIDCRVQIPYIYIEQNIDIDILIERTMDRFFRCYLGLIDKKIGCVSWGVHPSLELKNNPDLAYGDQKFRNTIVQKWNALLEHKSDIHNIPFISIFNDLINEDNTAKQKFFNDTHHLNSNLLWNIMNQKFIDKKLI